MRPGSIRRAAQAMSRRARCTRRLTIPCHGAGSGAVLSALLGMLCVVGRTHATPLPGLAFIVSGVVTLRIGAVGRCMTGIGLAHPVMKRFIRESTVPVLCPWRLRLTA